MSGVHLRCALHSVLVSCIVPVLASEDAFVSELGGSVIACLWRVEVEFVAGGGAGRRHEYVSAKGVESWWWPLSVKAASWRTRMWLLCLSSQWPGTTAVACSVSR